MVSSFESGFAAELEKEFNKINKKLTKNEADELFNELVEHAAFRQLIKSVRIKMASRDYSLRDVIHNKLEAYIQAMPEGDYERFLGEKSKDLLERIEESLDVYKRLKDS